ncbi:hypothetical protein SO694_0006500 [Aureococcus anophagefferens]|uniref:Uncharacterized protein n=1 Tax=Aureococcus anophagefferens TaxID=44056 RepID=A0ABR1FR08_AURAN
MFLKRSPYNAWPSTVLSDQTSLAAMRNARRSRSLRPRTSRRTYFA